MSPRCLLTTWAGVSYSKTACLRSLLLLLSSHARSGLGISAPEQSGHVLDRRVMVKVQQCFIAHRPRGRDANGASRWTICSGGLSWFPQDPGREEQPPVVHECHCRTRYLCNLLSRQTWDICRQVLHHFDELWLRKMLLRLHRAHQDLAESYTNVLNLPVRGFPRVEDLLCLE